MSPVNHSRETLFSLHPSIKGRSCPCEIQTNPTRFGCRPLVEDGPLSGVYCHPQTQLVGLGEMPLHRHRTMHNRLLDLHPIRGAFLLPMKTPRSIHRPYVKRHLTVAIRCALLLPITHEKTKWSASPSSGTICEN